MTGDLVIRWTARLAVAGYMGRLVCDVTQVPSRSNVRLSRWCWTIGCVWFVAHVIAAFHFLHGWNHAQAYDYTARRTTELTGWNSGVGLYVNEAFLVLWIIDIILWWRNLNWPQHRIAYWSVQAIFAFLMIQATAVFGPPWWRPVVLLFVVGIALGSAARRLMRADAVRVEDFE